jgi:hypothetical protein
MERCLLLSCHSNRRKVFILYVLVAIGKTQLTLETHVQAVSLLVAAKAYQCLAEPGSDC